MHNIAFDDTIFNIQKYGGISRYFSILATELVKQGHSVHINAGLYQNSYISELPSKKINGYNFSFQNRVAKKIIQCGNQLFSEGCAYRSAPDVIHETYYKSFSFKIKGSLRICTAHDFIHEIYPNNFPYASRTTKRKKDTFDRVDHIISISENTKKDLIEIFDVPEDKISVVHHGVDSCFFGEPRPALSIPYKDYILYVGARDGYKNFKMLIQACMQSPIIKNNIKIVAFGGGAFTSDELQFFTDCKILETSVNHVEGSDELLAKYYSNALVFVCPSLYEGFGLTVLEAMASGCPVIASNTSSLPEVVGNAGKLVDPKSAEEMQFAMEEIILSSSYRDELIQLGNRNVKNFSWQDCATNTLKVYTSNM